MQSWGTEGPQGWHAGQEVLTFTWIPEVDTTELAVLRHVLMSCFEACLQASAKCTATLAGICLMHHTNVGVSSAHITQLLVTCSLAILSGYGASSKSHGTLHILTDTLHQAFAIHPVGCKVLIMSYLLQPTEHICCPYCIARATAVPFPLACAQVPACL